MKKGNFHEIDQKTFKGIISGLHFFAFVNILPKLGYFEGRNYIQIGYKSYLVLLQPLYSSYTSRDVRPFFLA